MKEKSQMEIEYENYLSSDDKCVKIEGNVFYKVIHKQSISLRGGVVLITVPWELFDHSSEKRVIDENGKEFKLGEAVHYSFHESIPEWFLKTATINVESIHEINEIGDYVLLIKGKE